MPSGLALALIILAVLASSFYFLVQAEGGWGELPRLFERIGVPIPKPQPTQPSGSTSSVPAEFRSGNSRFSQGTCQTDADCIATGCSGEVCSGGGEVISTCEFSDSFPNVQGLSCQCIKGTCGWN